MGAEMVGLGATSIAQRTSKKILCTYVQRRMIALIKISEARYLSIIPQRPRSHPQLSDAPANIMSSGPHDYFGRSLCTTGDDATVDDVMYLPISKYLGSLFCTHS